MEYRHPWAREHVPRRQGRRGLRARSWGIVLYRRHRGPSRWGGAHRRGLSRRSLKRRMRSFVYARRWCRSHGHRWRRGYCLRCLWRCRLSILYSRCPGGRNGRRIPRSWRDMASRGRSLNCCRTLTYLIVERHENALVHLIQYLSCLLLGHSDRLKLLKRLRRGRLADKHRSPVA